MCEKPFSQQLEQKASESALFSPEKPFEEWELHLPDSTDVRFLQYTDSTNLQARKSLRSAEHPIKGLIVADAQSAGKGRFQREWRSPARCNLYFTLIIKPDCDLQLWAGVTQVAALTLAELLGDFGVPVQVKWPNDLLWNKHKICGMLAETMNDPQGNLNLLLGIGLNVNTPPDTFRGLDRLASSLKEISGKIWNRETLLQLFLDRFFSQLALYEKEGLSPFIDQWKVMDNFLNTRAVRVHGEEQTEGYIRDINEDGSLLFETLDGKTESVYSGDLEVPGARL